MKAVAYRTPGPIDREDALQDIVLDKPEAEGRDLLVKIHAVSVNPVDTKLRVKGLEGLRVADASVMPVTPVAALNAPSMLIGWRAAQYCS